ncbi:Git1p [Ascoidea rubescens DSM 1968]|uniref:Glycerophosphoinositol permease n=1 Tax=Ascoidea rubescens DSM 1968 TaxID=1344418 RepID=A0A1D2VD50_9ASCO|nr:glycerophosphoinositol permease [Ascoidea rubescens DSM 1968]ODV59561.1 glycerophosphoinositol permease [Ascoidea rubescens DSM 1968]
MKVLTRDLPNSFSEFAFGWYQKSQNETCFSNTTKKEKQKNFDENSNITHSIHSELENQNPQTKKNSIWAVLSSGAGLFSDGYINNSMSTTSTCLALLYNEKYTNSSAMNNVASIVFAGTVLGQLIFGYISDKVSRKSGMLMASAGLTVFSILCSASWGKNKNDVHGMLIALTVYRFILGFFLGAEYPCGSVSAAEASSCLPRRHRNRYFCMFTNFCIDCGFLTASIVPMILLSIFTPNNLTPVWRITLGFGAIPPLALFFMRVNFNDDESFQKLRFKKTSIPYFLFIKFYWFRLFIVSLVWFIYNFSVYAFGIYATFIIHKITSDGNLYKTFGFNILLNFFYILGSFPGCFVSDYLGPRLTLVLGAFLQSIIGYIMASCYASLLKNIGAFVFVYGMFLAFGEFGPGNNIGLLASKTSAAGIRGTYYSIAAAMGKVGAFVGTYTFSIIVKNAGGYDTVSGLQAPYWVASSLCLVSAILILFFLPSVDPDVMKEEDKNFLEYLKASGFEINLLGADRKEEKP